jgi:adenylate cyclase
MISLSGGWLNGIAEGLVTALCRYPALFVIRSSSFLFQGRAAGVKQVARELGARYLVEGSLRKTGNRARVTARLIEAETGKYL